MKKLLQNRLYVFTLIILNLLVFYANAEYLLESATLGETGFTSGSSVTGIQYLAASFHNETAFEVTHIGGHMVVQSGTAFGAIISLDDGEIIPPGVFLDSANVIAHTVFANIYSPSQEVRLPLSVVLEPGDYALVFGTNKFGASGEGGYFPNDDTSSPLPGSTISYYTEGNSKWHPIQFQNTRMTVEGHTIPEPGTLSLLALGSLAMLRRRK
jgi:hypothetical protein